MALIIGSILLGIAVIPAFLFFALGDEGPFVAMSAIPGVMGAILLLVHFIVRIDANHRLAVLRAGRGGIARIDRLVGVGQDSDGDTEYTLECTVSLDNGRLFRHRLRTRMPRSTVPGTILAVMQTNAKW